MQLSRIGRRSPARGTGPTPHDRRIGRDGEKGDRLAGDDDLHFYARDIAAEIFEELLEHTERDEPTSAANVAASLNNFYGLRLSPEQISAILDGQLGRAELTSVIEPMRTWPVVWSPP